MREWKPIATAPTDGSAFLAWDSKHGRCIMRRWYQGSTLHNETWAIDPSGIMDAPDPHLWTELAECPE